MPSVKHQKRKLRTHFLRAWREYRGLDQEKAAERLGISRTQLSKIENIKSPYSQGLLEAAAEAYSCTVADLLIRNPNDKDAPWSLQDSLKKAPAPVRDQIKAVVETLLKTGS